MKKTIIGIVVGIIISGTTVYAASILSSSVVYDNSTSNGSSKTVQGALDELYSKLKYGDATAEDILSGKTALVHGQEVTGTLASVSSMKHIKSQWFVNSSSLKLLTDATVLVFVTDNGYFTAYHNGVNIGSSRNPFEPTIWILTCFGDFKTGDTISISRSMNLEVSMYK